MNKVQESLKKGNEFLELIAENDEAEARYYARRAEFKRIGEELRDYRRDDVACRFGEGSEALSANFMALITERLTGEDKPNFMARFDFFAEKFGEE